MYRQIFGHKRGVEKTTSRVPSGGVLLTKCYVGNQIKKNEMGWKCGMYGRQERYIRGFVWDTLGRRALGRRRSRWEDNIKMDLWAAKAWTGLLWLRIGTAGGHL